MRVLLFLAATLAGFLAFWFSAMAKTSIHEIYGGVVWVIATLLFVGAAIVDAVVNASNRIERAINDLRNTVIDRR